MTAANGFRYAFLALFLSGSAIAAAPAKRLTRIERGVEAAVSQGHPFEVSVSRALALESARRELASLDPNGLSDRRAVDLQALRSVVDSQLLKAAFDSRGKDRIEYGWLVQGQMGFPYSPESVQAQGYALAARLRRRMETLADQMAPGRDLRSLMRDLQDDLPSNESEVVAKYASATKRSEDFIREKRLFDVSRLAPLKFLRTPVGENSGPLASYIYNRKGSEVWISPDPGSQEKFSRHYNAAIPGMVVHEATPGHHLQFSNFYSHPQKSIARRLALSMVPLARNLSVEGYAFYVEELMRQTGFFNPREELANLSLQLLRAYRLVVDPALHTGRMSAEDVVKLLSENAFLSPEAALEEVAHCLSMPGRAITYYLGRLQIERIKRRLRAIAGPTFSEAAFHSNLLSHGPAPVPWIAPVMLKRAMNRAL